MVGLRERKRLRTREAVAEAALDLFRRRGFAAVTVEEIAEAAEISRRTFFRYFPTKEAVVFPHENRRMELFRRLLAGQPRDLSPWRKVREALLALARDYERDRERVLAQEKIVAASTELVAKERLLDERWEAEIARALEGSFPARRARILAGAVVGVVRVVLREWAAGGGRSNLVREGAEALDLLGIEDRRFR